MKNFIIITLVYFITTLSNADTLEYANADEYSITIESVKLCQNATTIRAGSGHFFHGAGRVSGLLFWPGSGSGYWKSTTGQFRAKYFKFGQFRANFGPISGRFRADFGPILGCQF